jgi:hypothetical protein
VIMWLSPVRRDGHGPSLSWGDAHTPLSVLTEVYLLAPGFSCHLPAPPSTALAMALHGYNFLSEQRIGASMIHNKSRTRLDVPPRSGSPATPGAAPRLNGHGGRPRHNIGTALYLLIWDRDAKLPAPSTTSCRQRLTGRSQTRPHKHYLEIASGTTFSRSSGGRGAV